MTYYFDHNATTPLSEAVLACVTRVLRDCYGNPSSIHAAGQAARQEVERARGSVAALLNADPHEIVFTSGGTESDNLAILGAGRPGGAAGKHVITTAIEHPAVLGACAQLAREGAEVTFLNVSGDGVVDPEDVRRALRPSTALISVMHANNETGAIQPIAEISALAREAGVLFHSDGVQAAGRLETDVQALGVDLYSLSAHKLNAPKGAGALFVRKGVKLQALQFGGRHERERRAGTENVPGIAALGCAAGQLQQHRASESVRLKALRDRLETRIFARVHGVKLNSGSAARLSNTASLRFDGIEGEALVIALDLAGFAVSSGAACSSGAVEPSHVLLAMGLTPAEARSSLRFSLGQGNDEAQVDALSDAVAASVARLRKLSPVYEHA
ncbi:MAG: cysteine desulfurase family protein [Bryobacteraceae bacterium]|nr:cysteine desulfurase family protein [Bryobacteraceae bacterium]